jgi:tetratricopeptide (TPR) repeat protein
VRLHLLQVAVLSVAACQSDRNPEPKQASTTDRAGERAPIFEGMGNHRRKVSTSNAEAQRYFDQALALCYGFNHDEAANSFTEAARLDPGCAMAYWGQAYALGPNYNLPYDEGQHRQAYAAIQKAIEKKPSASPAERDLIDALAARFEDPPLEDREHLDKAYGDAMAEVWKKHPNDTDIGVLYVDARMNQNRWNLWTKGGKPNTHTLEIIATLERVFELDINHPGANHLYIHAIEPSPNPGKAEAAADRLGALVPGSGHLVHMPAHIYVQMGRYMDSIACNRKASRIDREYFARVGTKGIYHFYHLHNTHFLIWSAMYAGRYEDAVTACDQMVKDVPDQFLGVFEAAEFLSSKLHVLIRFGRWEEVLATPAMPENQPYARAMWHYARGIAYANTGRYKEATEEARKFENQAAAVDEDSEMRYVPALEVLNIAREMLAGETAFKQGDHEIAFKHLTAAVATEDALHYTEPSPWMVPTRHALGALLLQQGKIEEAEKCYRKALKLRPGNGWALHGLAECLERRDQKEAAAKVRKQFDEAWTNATVEIKASCFCRTVR